MAEISPANSLTRRCSRVSGAAEGEILAQPCGSCVTLAQPRARALARFPTYEIRAVLPLSPGVGVKVR